MAITGVDHTSFTVSDLEGAVEWFTTLLGVEPLVRGRSSDPYMKELVGYPDCDLEYAYFPLPGGSKLELIQYHAPRGKALELETNNVGVAHICLVVDDVEAEAERLSEIATFRSAPVEKPTGPNRGGLGLYMRGPDGITVELLSRP
jgi:catechol 2,3-dioxygenase-like lactoylglutathione lyase family enzyme